MISGDSYVRAVNLTGLDIVFTRHGGDFPALLAEVGLPADVMDHPDRLISYRKSVALFETAGARCSSANLGLETAMLYAPQFPIAGPTLLLARFSKDVREWLTMGLRYWSYHTNGYVLKLIESPDTDVAVIRLVIDAYAGPIRHCSEALMAVLFGLARSATEQLDAPLTLVRFAHLKPADIAMHEALFHCPIEFGCEHTEVHFHKEVLNIKTAGGLGLFKPIVGFFLQERIKRIKFYDQSTTTAVALVIPSIIGSGTCRIETVADALGLGMKQLQRALDKEGTSFSEILESVRERMARNYLSDTTVPISRIAGLLDYSAAAPFTLAFQRWAGMPPLQFRKIAQKDKDQI